jgi:hypothetical protein
MLRSFFALGLLCAGAAAAQALPPEHPDWKELEAPPPPAVRTTGLVEVDVPGSTLRFGVDPATVTVGDDGIVRYVVVATSRSGAINAMYEGIHCHRGDVKVYARWNPDTGWSPQRKADWQALQDVPNARYSLQIARTGACFGRAPNGPASKVVRDLKAPIDRRFENTR